MCVTEPHAGSDLGLVHTKRIPEPDGSFAINGSRIFSSGGAHDLTDHIVHLLLGRLPDAPAGPKGLSLFHCPKVLPDGMRNAVHSRVRHQIRISTRFSDSDPIRSTS